MPRTHFKKENSVTLLVKRPHITEKATMLSAHGAYTFIVASHADKKSVAAAIKDLYKVTPIKVNIINLPAKKVSRRGVRGTVSGYKKAVVYLKKGDTIELV